MGVASYVFRSRIPPEPSKTACQLPELPEECARLLEILDDPHGFGVAAGDVLSQTTRDALDFCSYHGLFKHILSHPSGVASLQGQTFPNNARCPALLLTDKGRACLAQHHMRVATPPAEPDGQSGDGPEEPKERRGPASPNLFCWPGCVDAELQPIPWRLVQHLWVGPERKGTIELVAEAVWGGFPTDSAIRNAVSRANRSLSEPGIPAQVRSKNGFLCLDVESL